MLAPSQNESHRWILSQEKDRQGTYFVTHRRLFLLTQVADYVSKGVGEWYPYDVSCNIIRSYDHTRLHGDVRNSVDDEWTFLLYLSDMKPGDYGETSYFESNSDNTEIVYQVWPWVRVLLTCSCAHLFSLCSLSSFDLLF